MQPAINTRSIMLDFAASTGLSGASHEPRRYLWTDAFAVCNYLELYAQTGEQDFLHLALTLVDQVHQVLGEERKDSGRSGWLSRLDEEQGRRHPTCGGLRIGKNLNERQAHEAVDESLEWEQDGQYFHYLTKWMHALNRVSEVTSESIYNQWALELARVAHAAFCIPAKNGTKRMVWKMSIDLTRPLVTSMGQHDPLDGLITYQQLETTAKQFTETPPELSLQTEIEEMHDMCAGRNWASEDALGIGGLLVDAYALVQLISLHDLPDTGLLKDLLHDIEVSLRAFTTHNSLSLDAACRLAFRELGLAIGLRAMSKMQKRIARQPELFSDAQQMLALLSRLSYLQRIHELIEDFWLEPDHQAVQTWQEHADINSVMLATSLAPDAFLAT